MTGLSIISRIGVFLLFTATLATGARAGDTGDPPVQPDPVDVTFSLGAVSDYRYRGISLSDKSPSLQAELAVAHGTGFYGVLWAATIANNGGAGLENQVTLGYAAEAGATTFDVNAAYYIYPGASNDNYGEVAARLGHAIGPAELGAIISYAPAQQNIGDVDNLYIGLDASVPLGPAVALNGSIGLEDGAFGDRKLDWSLGVAGEAAGLTLGVAYVDASRTFGDPLANPSIVASISKTF